MSLTSEQGAALIMAEVTKPAPLAAAAAAPAAIAAVDLGGFCDIWPKVRPILETIAGILPLLSFLPIGPIAGPVLAGLIKIGDQIAKDQCG